MGLTEISKTLIVEHCSIINTIKSELNNNPSIKRINELIEIINAEKVALIIRFAEGAGQTKEDATFKLCNNSISDIANNYDGLLELLFKKLTNEEDSTKPKPNSYQELRERLTTYISITTEDLKKLIEGQPLQKGAAKWIGKPIEAYRFAYWLNPKGTERHKNFKAFFNNNIAGVKVHGNQSKGLVLGLEGSIWDILKQYRPTKEID